MPPPGLTIVAKITARKEKTEFVKSELIKLIEPTLLEEGCINYDLHQDNEDDHIFLFYENWASRESWLKHMESPHIKRHQKVAKEAVEGVVLYEMTKV